MHLKTFLNSCLFLMFPENDCFLSSNNHCIHSGGIQLSRLHLRGSAGPLKYQHMQIGGMGVGGVGGSLKCKRSHIFFLIKHLVHKLLKSSIKIPDFLKIFAFLSIPVFLPLCSKKLNFATNFPPTSKELYLICVVRVLDKQMVKFSVYAF